MASFDNSQIPIEVGYWSIRGLAAPLRMMVMYRNVPLKAENYDLVEKPTHDGFDASHWFNHKPTLKAKNPLINLPYVLDGDRVVTQSNACFLYLGRRLNLLGKNDSELIDCEQLLCEIMDLRNSVVQFAYGGDDGEHYLKGITKHGQTMDKLNLWLERKYENNNAETLFFVGEEASAPDFHIWEILDQLNGIAHHFIFHDLFTNYPKLAAFHRSFRALPQNQRYFESKLFQLPANNLSARAYGATPEGSKFVHGQATPWQKSSGIYY